MSEQKPIDIMQEFVDLYGKEEMLAFFDFSIERPGSGAIAGLCRISRPKSSGAKMQYLSLTFVADTPDEQARRAVATVLERIDADGLRRAVAEVSEVVCMPGMGDAAQTYVAQTDILLDTAPDEQFITVRLLPAIRRLMQVKPTEVVWWAESATPGKQSARPAVSAEAQGSLVSNIRSYLSKNFRGERG
ncbi:MAG TPA: hypothetical protein VMW56_08480 [Candidatus Margulisiibacteriota bacterium]|nr:hypothetical protein [Candidatus Margulisiibacteriota bacterium]